MWKLLRSPAFTLAASAVTVAGVTALAYGRLGFLGVALVGFSLLFMAVQSELQKDGVRTPFAVERMSRTERLARAADGQNMARFWTFTAILGAALAAIGLAGFASLQLPS